MSRSRRLALAAGVLLAASLLSACSAGTVHLEPAPDANNPRCADVIVRLKEAKSVAGQDRRWTDAQATASWGDPTTTIILACGVAVPAPTSELQCVTLNGVDWLVDPAEAPNMRLTTYGRDPAVQVYADTSVVSANDVLSSSIASAVATIPADGRCTAADELPDDYTG